MPHPLFCEIQGLSPAVKGQYIGCYTISATNQLVIDNFNDIYTVPLPANIIIDFRLLIVSTSPKPKVSIDTFYIFPSPSITTALVDFVHDVPLA